MWGYAWEGGNPALPIITNGSRVNFWTLHFFMEPGTPPQTVTIDTMGAFDFGYNPIFMPGEIVIRPATGLDENLSIRGFALLENYPNPFNPSTTIEFSLAEGGNVSLGIYDMLGRKIRQLHEGYLNDGSYSVVWDGKDDSGVAAPSGTYFYRLVC
jgi:hypothetical protein